KSIQRKLRQRRDGQGFHYFARVPATLWTVIQQPPPSLLRLVRSHTAPQSLDRVLTNVDRERCAWNRLGANAAIRRGNLAAFARIASYAVFNSVNLTPGDLVAAARALAGRINSRCRSCASASFCPIRSRLVAA